MRAALYMRVSTSDQAHDLQRDELLGVATQRHWQVTQYCDVGSGKAGANLPERDRMLRDARAGKLDLVVVWRLDRLGRSARELLEISEALERWNVGLLSLMDGIESRTPAGKLLLSVLGAVAELERTIITERVTAGIAAAKARGVRFGRPTVQCDDDQARRLLAQGLGQRAVAGRLGISPRTLRRRVGQKPPSEQNSQVPENTGAARPRNDGGTR